MTGSKQKRQAPPEGGTATNMGVLPTMLGYMLRQSQLLYYQHFHALVDDEAIRPPQFSILEVIGGNPGIRPSDVAVSLGISRANLVPLLTDLETRWLIRRLVDRNDGRAQSLHLTEAGITKLRDLHAVLLPFEDRLATGLGPDGRERLLDLLHTLLRNAAKP